MEPYDNAVIKKSIHIKHNTTQNPSGSLSISLYPVENLVENQVTDFRVQVVGRGIRNIRSQDYSFPGTFVPWTVLLYCNMGLPFLPLRTSFMRSNSLVFHCILFVLLTFYFILFRLFYFSQVGLVLWL